MQFQETYDPNSINGEKLHFQPQIRATKFFFPENQSSSVTRYRGQLSSCTTSEKANDPILRKFIDGRTDRRKDRQTDEFDFIGCCPTNVKRRFPSTNGVFKG